MFFNFDLNSRQATFEIYLGEQLIQTQTVEMPVEMLKGNFINLMQQIANENRPMRVKMIVYDEIWDNFEQRRKTIENYVEFKNSLMMEK